MNIFKHEHPSNLISRLFILEYMREIGAEVLYKKANKHQKEKFFYKYTVGIEGEESTEQVDLNYEYCTFIASLIELETFLKQFLTEIEAIETSREKIYEAAREQEIAEELATPVDVNVMDLAQTEINKNKPGQGGLILN